MNRVIVIFSAMLLVSLNVSPASAAEGKHDHGSHDHGDHSQHDAAAMSHQHGDMFLEKRTIDGYDVSFHVMKASDGMQHGGSYNFMVKVEKGGKSLDDVVINSKVIFPDDKADSKMLMRMGDWYMNGYDLKEKGRHQLIILFKTADGKKHQGGVYYPAK